MADAHPHPDPEGHLTDITISRIREIRDSLHDMELVSANWLEKVLNEVLEPWGEGPTG